MTFIGLDYSAIPVDAVSYAWFSGTTLVAETGNWGSTAAAFRPPVGSAGGAPSAVAPAYPVAASTLTAVCVLQLQALGGSSTGTATAAGTTNGTAKLGNSESE